MRLKPKREDWASWRLFEAVKIATVTMIALRAQSQRKMNSWAKSTFPMPGSWE